MDASPYTAWALTVSMCLSVCLSVCLSQIAHMYVRLVRKMSNQSTWKFRKTSGPWKSITGSSIMTSSQIQDGGQPLLIRKSLCRHICVKNDPIMFLDITRRRIVRFLADRTNGRAYATVLRLSVVCLSSVTLCIVAKRCVLEQKLLLRAYRKSYMRNRLVPKWMTLTFV